MIFDATSPAAWPPMPSETTVSAISDGMSRLSSLCARTMPMSVLPAKRMRWGPTVKEMLMAVKT